MLARSYLDANTLGISDKVHQALITVLHQAERNEIEIKMDMWNVCIAGNVCNVLGERTNPVSTSIHNACTKAHELSELVFMREVPNRFYDKRITHERAVLALRNYLTTGKANWNEVLKQ